MNEFFLNPSRQLVRSMEILRLIKNLRVAKSVINLSVSHTCFWESINLKQNTQNIHDKFLVKNNLFFNEAESFIFLRTIKDNLLLEIDKKIDKANLIHTIINFYCALILEIPKQIYTLLAENNNELSIDKKQRISILRPLTREPELLILDEATSNLNGKTENNIFAWII